MSRKYSVLVVEDEPLIAEDIAGYLLENGFAVLAIANNAKEALEILKDNMPDAILLDINLGDGMDGIELATQIRTTEKIPVVFLTSHADKATLDRAKQTIPAGYLLKPFDGKDIMTSLEIAIFSHSQQNGIGRTEPDLNGLNEALPVALSQREFEILTLLKTGKTNKEMADALFISVNTVKTHMLHLFEKLDVSNRTQALFRIREMTGSR
ncbi:response regulator transcription factor [Cryomorpha ignava]|uniref:Response regulator transcription factor n=1 Tax=Cryomorpha ignava TaxID=101383 RepID=A0A7K3WT12_9FLAO|nr:response regulator transcription factor [Cryomorpha ignava]NEN24191.1 response regulator transcription factor [Cryomorpha ignava]